MRIPPAPTPEPSEWQTDKDGRRYRQIGQLIEYEMEINGVPQSQFAEMQKRQKEQAERQRKEAEQKAAEYARVRRNCPFRDTNSTQTDCSREACALFLNGCSLASMTPAKDTKELQCPFNRYRLKCRTDCALYKGGCTLTGLITKTESEDHGQNE